MAFNLSKRAGGKEHFVARDTRGKIVWREASDMQSGSVVHDICMEVV